jgi:hypothetical protein
VSQLVFNNKSSRGIHILFASLIGALFFFPVFLSKAEESTLDTLPEPRHLAAALSDTTSRMDALMTMAVVAHLLNGAVPSNAIDPDSMKIRFGDERAWLDHLALRFPALPLRSAVLDPSAWFMLLELDQRQLAPALLVSPLGPPTRDLMEQVFNRADERLAASFLPELLMRMESLAPGLWQGLLSKAEEDELLRPLLNELNAEWFDRWMAAEPPAPVGLDTDEDVTSQALQDLQAMAQLSMVEGAPDALRLKRIRFTLLSALPEMNPVQSRELVQLLRLATAVDGLRDRRYLAFAETLLWLVSDMLLAHFPMTEAVISNMEVTEEGEGEVLAEPAEVAEPVAASEAAENSVPESAPEPESVQEALPVSDLAKALPELLHRLSSAFARDFSEVDSRINASLAAAFDVVQNIQESSSGDPAVRTRLIRELANAVAQFVLLIPDMDFYFDQPVRAQITEEIGACMSIAAAKDPNGLSTVSREQYDGCLLNMAELADSMTRSAELSGDMDGPYAAAQLQRELALTPWQRINYALGYLHEKNTTACEQPENPLPNPLEWSALATTFSWFARQAPVYMKSPENEALIMSMKQQGSELLQAMERQVDCFSSQGPGVSDPVSMSQDDYRLALAELISGIRETDLLLREETLAPGADIVLHGNAEQTTAYRPDELIIGPCRPARVCEMTGELAATRALIGLFPDAYLVADQARLGKIEICYDNMQWVQRRAEPVREDDPHVANYYGHLSFDLIGRFVEAGNTREVFGSNFISPDEYHYLFAAAGDEVLDDSCPSEWVGSKIVTKLNTNARFRVVPDRLTYLAAARSQPSQIMNLNWNRGAEWRDWFVTGLGITKFEFEADETLPDRIAQHLQALNQAKQVMFYRALLRPPSRGGVDESMSLIEEMNAVTTAKALLRTQMNLFYPDVMLDSDHIRGSLEGTRALIDSRVLRRFREANVPVESIGKTGTARLEEFRSHWSRQPEVTRRSGTATSGVAHAIARLNALYLDYFKPETVEENQVGVSGFRG